MWSGVPTETASTLPALLVEQLAKILVPARLGEVPERSGGAVLVHVAEGDDVRPQTGVGGDVSAAHPPGTNAREVDPFARGQVSRPPQHVPGDDREVQRDPSGRRPQEYPSRTFRRGCVPLSAHRGGSPNPVVPRPDRRTTMTGLPSSRRPRSRRDRHPIPAVDPWRTKSYRPGCPRRRTSQRTDPPRSHRSGPSYRAGCLRIIRGVPAPRLRGRTPPGRGSRPRRRTGRRSTRVALLGTRVGEVGEGGDRMFHASVHNGSSRFPAPSGGRHADRPCPY